MAVQIGGGLLILASIICALIIKEEKSNKETIAKV
jgi:hypothetical protein